MARIALIDPSGRAATTVDAVLGSAHDIVVRPRIHAPGDVELVIADLRYADLADQGTLRSLTSFGPVLVLVDRKDPVPPAVEESANLSVLRKPFDAFELRLKVEQLLQTAASPTERRPTMARHQDDDCWLEFPFVPVAAGAVLRRAAKLSAPLWILGEPGSGRQRIAMAVCRVARPPLRAVTLFPDERLQMVLARERKSEPFALIVPEIEQRPLIEQERLAAILSGQRGFRLIATSIDDPARKVVDGEFSRNLYRHLTGLAVQISPLREQPIAIPPLAQALARRLAHRLGIDGEVSFNPAAMAKLQTYMWPGNVLELEAVLTRTLTHLGESDEDGRMIEPHELLFTADEAMRPRSAARSAAGRGDAARQVSQLLPEHSSAAPAASGRPAVPARSASQAGTSRPEPPQGGPSSAPSPPATRSPAESAEPENFETVVAGLAHDLRNPMTVIKTFAGTIAGERFEADTVRELGGRVSRECDRLNACLEALQRFSEFGAPEPKRLDFIDLIRHALADQESEIAERVSLRATGSAEMKGDPTQLRFVADNLIEAGVAELHAEASLTIDRDADGAVVFKVPAGVGPVTKLRRLSGSEASGLSWRILLARAIAARNGCVVDVKVVGDAMTIRCLLHGGEEGSRGQQTGRIDH